MSDLARLLPSIFVTVTGWGGEGVLSHFLCNLCRANRFPCELMWTFILLGVGGGRGWQ